MPFVWGRIWRLIPFPNVQSPRPTIVGRSYVNTIKATLQTNRSQRRDHPTPCRWTLPPFPGHPPWNPNQYPVSVQDLITDQEIIGWDQFVCGWISSLWSFKHSNSLLSRRRAQSPYNSGPQWTSTIVKIIWEHIHKLWLHRNQLRHGKDKAEQLQKQWEQHIAEMTIL